MTAYGSPSAKIMVDGYDLTPLAVESMARKKESIMQPTNGFSVATVVNSPVGVTRGTLTVGGGLFDETVDPLHAGVAGSGVGVSRVVCLCEAGQTKGSNFTGYEGTYSQASEVLDANEAITKANVTYLVSGQVDEGVILQELASKTADWDTTATSVDEADNPGNRHIPIATSSVANPTVITTVDDHGLVTGEVVAIFEHTSVDPDINDNPAAAEAWKLIGHTITRTGAKTFTIPVNVTDAGIDGYCVCVSRAKGGYGYQQVTQGSGFTNYVGKIRHAVDNSTWADLVTFADTLVDYHNGQRVATATATTQVRRYLSWSGDVTGAVGATPFHVFGGFARGA